MCTGWSVYLYLHCLEAASGCYPWSSISTRAVQSTGGSHCISAGILTLLNTDPFKQTSRGAEEQRNTNRMPSRRREAGKRGLKKHSDKKTFEAVERWLEDEI